MKHQRYVDLRSRLVEAHGRLDLEAINQINRDHYRSIDWPKGPTTGGSSHQLAFDPKTGDFIIAFCKGNPLIKGRAKVSAFNQPTHRYNFFELLEKKPDQAP